MKKITTSVFILTILTLSACQQAPVESEEIIVIEEVTTEEESPVLIVSIDDNGNLYEHEQPLTQRGQFYLDSDERSIYHFEKDIYNYESESNSAIQIKKIDSVNFDEFTVYDRDGRYAKDSENVFFLSNISLSYQYEYELTIIEEADPDSFEPLISEFFDIPKGNYYIDLYSRDLNHIYYGAEILEAADPNSFQLTSLPSITMDSETVFLWNKAIPGAVPESFEILADLNGGRPGNIYSKDSTTVFVQYCALTDLDTDSTQVLDGDDLIFSDKDGEFTINYEHESNTCSIIRY